MIGTMQVTSAQSSPTAAFQQTQQGIPDAPTNRAAPQADREVSRGETERAVRAPERSESDQTVRAENVRSDSRPDPTRGSVVDLQA